MTGLPGTIGFETGDGFVPSEGLTVSTQFRSSDGVVFSLEGGGSPVLADYGGARTGFQGPGDGNDNLAVGEPDLGAWFLTDDGRLAGLSAPALIVSYDSPTTAASGYILDIDFGETFRIEVYDGPDATGTVVRTIELDESAGGDGAATLWSFDLGSSEARSIRFSGSRTQAGVFGLGFDDFDARSAAPPALTLGLGHAGQGYLEELDASAPFAHRAWPRLPWADYVGAVGETRPARCDLDGDGRTDTVTGLASYPAEGGYLHVRDAATGASTWLRVPWAAYNAVNGETFPACGDIDGDGRAEIVVGLGAGGAGWVRVFDDARSGFAPYPDTPGGVPGWLRLGWGAYNDEDGTVHPAVGNLDADAAEEIVLGTARHYVQVLDDGAAGGFAPSASTPEAGGWVPAGSPGGIARDEHVTWPAICATGEAGRARLVIGSSTLGGGPGGFGWLRVLDAAAGYAGANEAPVAGGWVRVPWGDYASAVGSTRPSCGQADTDGADEIAVGLGSYPVAGGYVSLLDDADAGYSLVGWPRVRWSGYNGSDGRTIPALDR